MVKLKMTFWIGIACIIVACQLLWMGHTLLGRSTACFQSLEASSFLMPPKKAIQQKLQQNAVHPHVINKFARAFPRWNHPELPCVQAEKQWWHPTVLRSPAKEGILFVRNMKTASSTLAGVAIRMARSFAKKTPNINGMCKVRFDHTPAFKLGYGKRNKQKSFLWSFLRDPTDRAVSEFFHFGVSRLKLEPSDANFKKYMLEMRKYMTNNYFLLDMTLQPFLPKRNPNFTIDKAVQQIVQNYDFIGLVERMDESLVILKMILGLDMNDILYLSAKRNGGWDEGAYNATCTYIVPSFVSKGMQTFFKGNEWQEYTAGDRLLFQVVNKSLDMTIDSLGKDEFETQLRHYRTAKARAQELCGPSTVYPCSEGGVRRSVNPWSKNSSTSANAHSCLWWDSGCGYKCLDRLKLNDIDTGVLI